MRSTQANQLETVLAEKAEIAGAVAIAQLAMRAAKDKIARLDDRVHELEIDNARAVIELENNQWFKEHPAFAQQSPAHPDEMAATCSPLFVETASQEAEHLQAPAEQPLLAESAPAAGAAQVDRAAGSEGEVRADDAVKSPSGSKQAGNSGITRTSTRRGERVARSSN